MCSSLHRSLHQFSYLSGCLSTHLSAHPSMGVSIHPCTHASAYVCLGIFHLFLPASVRLSVHAFVHASVNQSVHASVRPSSVCGPCIHPSILMRVCVHLFVPASVHLFIHLARMLPARRSACPFICASVRLPLHPCVHPPAHTSICPFVPELVCSDASMHVAMLVCMCAASSGVLTAVFAGPFFRVSVLPLPVSVYPTCTLGSKGVPGDASVAKEALLHRSFEDIDTDGNGTLDRDELLNAMY